MKTKFLVLSLITLSSVAFMGTVAGATEKVPEDFKIKLAKGMALEQFKRDTSVSILEVERGVCGRKGPTYIVMMKVKKNFYEDKFTGITYPTNGSQTVKKYSIPIAELNEKAMLRLYDTEECGEFYSGTVTGSKKKTPNDLKIKFVEKMAIEQFTHDSSAFLLAVERGICGRTGPTFLIKMNVKKMSSYMDEGGNMHDYDGSEAVKEYSVPISQFNGNSMPRLFDNENCREL